MYGIRMNITEIYETLKKINILEFAEAKGNANLLYLPWAKAHEIMMENFPKYTWEWEMSEDHNPYFMTATGYFVITKVNVLDNVRKEILAVTDYNNKVLTSPNAFDINTAIRRCYVKNLAQFGLGLQLYIGGKPKVSAVKPAYKPKVAIKNPITKSQIEELRSLCAVTDAVSPERLKTITNQIKSNKATKAWAETSIKDIKNKIKKVK